MTNKKNTLTPEDIKCLFGEEELPPLLSEYIIEQQCLYSPLTPSKKESLLVDLLKILYQDKEPKPKRGSIALTSGEHRANDWERGWSENLDRFKKTGSTTDLSPRYWNKYDHMRWGESFVEMIDKDFEKKFQSIVVYWMASKYLQNAKKIYEFGCGTGHNLLTMHKINPTAQFYGLDWARSSQELVTQIGKQLNIKCNGLYFDFFNPDPNITLDNDTHVVTVAALEQMGDNFHPFLEYLMSQKAQTYIHLEPISEFLDPENSLMDFIMEQYLKKRNYLTGFYARLQHLQAEKKITIVQATRIPAGGLMSESFSLIVWKLI